VGGTDPADRNLISGNDFAGVTIVNASTTSNWVEGNFIGTDDTGDLPLPNAGPGVRIFNVAGITVGGGAPGAGNRIAFNGGAGIRVDATAGSANALLGNSIEANAGLGLDLGGDGVTSNDPPASLDGDGGPNGLQPGLRFERLRRRRRLPRLDERRDGGKRSGRLRLRRSVRCPVGAGPHRDDDRSRREHLGALGVCGRSRAACFDRGDRGPRGPRRDQARSAGWAPRSRIPCHPIRRVARRHLRGSRIRGPGVPGSIC
jgi:hypothetical protein